MEYPIELLQQEIKSKLDFIRELECGFWAISSKERVNNLISKSKLKVLQLEQALKILNGETVKLRETCSCDNLNKKSEIDHGLKLCRKCRKLHVQVE